MIWKYITCQHSFWHQFCNNFAFQLTSAIAPQSLPTRVFSVMLIFYKWYHPRDIPKDISHLQRVADRSTFDFPHSIPPRFSRLSDLKIGFENTEIFRNTPTPRWHEGWSWFTSNAKFAYCKYENINIKLICTCDSCVFARGTLKCPIFGPWTMHPPSYVISNIFYLIYPPKINMSTEKGPFKKDMSSSNHQFFGGICEFSVRGITLKFLKIGTLFRSLANSGAIATCWDFDSTQLHLKG